MPAGSIGDGDYVEHNGFVYEANVAGSGVMQPVFILLLPELVQFGP